jgi:preprotein translocase subunit SecD
MNKALEILKSWQVWILILVILGAFVSINPKFGVTGVRIAGVSTNSSAELNGLQTGQKIIDVNGIPISDLNSYNSAIADIKLNNTVKLTTDKGEFSFLAEEKDNATFLGLDVQTIPTTNLKQGIDLVGGVRVMLQPSGEATAQQMTDIISITERRLNTFGLSDVSVKQVSDLSGNRFLLVEMAGTTEQQAAKLISQQGKFEAKIGNESIFVGGQDIRQVCKSADCAGIRNCGESDNGWACQFQFKVDVSPESAKKHADLTRNMGTVNVNGNYYLEQKLDLYLDDKLVDSLYISESLKGVESTSFVIEGPGGGNTKDAAIQDALTRMKEMQTVLITGALPVKLDLVKIDVISPTLGEQFLRYAIIAIIGAIAAVGVIIFIRYKQIKVASAVLLTGLSEVFIILGVAAAIRWNLDLAAIAALIATVGTGVDSQIVITDEILSGEKVQMGWKERIKRAFFIIFGSYATVLAAMLPLYGFGTAMLKGFAIITVLGVSIGVFITRPAFAKIVEILLKT